ncbi:MAG: hypothetical protein PVH04_13815, partial [Gammaproteobacteria bacterium]
FVLFMGISQFAHAFDENRTGFILGLGAGLHTIDIDSFNNGFQLGSDSESGIATSLKLGGGITNQFALYYVRNASWFSSDGSNTTFLVGISGLGASYYFSSSAPSGYILAAVGVGDIDAPFESNIEADTGNATMIGGGYEVNDHLHLEVTLLRTDIDSSDFSNLTLETSSIQFTFNYLWY